MDQLWKESIYLQREELAIMLREPMAHLAALCLPAWSGRENLNEVIRSGYSGIPHCDFVYCLDPSGRQLSDNFGHGGFDLDHFGRDRSQRPYMKEAIPSWGFLLSDAYISLRGRRPSLTALQVVRKNGELIGYLGADFDLRNLPVTSRLYEEPGSWRQLKGDQAIRNTVFLQSRVESTMDKSFDLVMPVLEELIADRGVFQCMLHFSSSRVTIWTMDDPYRYRLLEQEALSDPDICLIFPSRPYPLNAEIPRGDIPKILSTMQSLRTSDPTFYLRTASINIFNGTISLTFSCDGSHYMSYVEFLMKGSSFWFGV
jgi:hypothetical protein